ncbi:hypothetical protein Tco_0602397, partial [Tanacetum coccineum]
ESSKSSWPLNSLGAQVEVIKTLENSCPIGWFGIAKLSMRPCGCGDSGGDGFGWLWQGRGFWVWAGLALHLL